MNENILEDIGLSKNEAKVYLALIELGSSTVSKISEKSGVHRTNCHDVLNRLIEKGLVAHITKNNARYYEATDPNSLLNILKEKEHKIKKILPQLKLGKELAVKSEANIHEGLPAAKHILNHLLEKKETILVYGVISDVAELIGPFLEQFHKKRIKQKIWMKHIYNTDAKDRINYLNKLQYTEARTLPREFDSPVATNICGDEVVLILWKKKALTIQIKNKEIADAYRRYFELMWKLAKIR